MYAIVEIAGQQFKVKEKQQIFVHRLEANEGDSITFDCFQEKKKKRIYSKKWS